MPQRLADTPGSIAGQETVHKLLNGRDESVFVERVGGEHVGIVTGEHQVFFQLAAVGDGLKRLLNTKRAGVRYLAGRAFFVISPITEPAGTQAPYAVLLVAEDFFRFVRRYENDCGSRGF